MATMTMSVSDWIDVPDNPRQRDTEKRAKSARSKHLAKYQKPHRVVFAASKEGSILCKIDGHTRALLWKLGDLETPPDGRVEVVLFDVCGIEEAKELYDMVDAQPVAKKPSDNIFGACRELGFRLDSSLLRGCAFATQLKIASSGKKFTGDLYKLVKDWKPELIALDAMGFSSKHTILISVMLVAIRHDGHEKCQGFFMKLENNEGEKSSKGYDGVELLARTIGIRRAEGRMAGYEHLMNICGQSWAAYEMWKKGQVRKNAHLPIADFTKIVVELNKKGAK
jgi:hypothetical protein